MAIPLQLTKYAQDMENMMKRKHRKMRAINGARSTCRRVCMCMCMCAFGAATAMRERARSTWAHVHVYVHPVRQPQGSHEVGCACAGGLRAGWATVKHRARRDWPWHSHAADPPPAGPGRTSPPLLLLLPLPLPHPSRPCLPHCSCCSLMHPSAPLCPALRSQGRAAPPQAPSCPS